VTYTRPAWVAGGGPGRRAAWVALGPRQGRSGLPAGSVSIRRPLSHRLPAVQGGPRCL